MVKCNAIQEMWIKQIKKDYNDSKRINITFPIKHDPPHYSNGKPILNEFYLKPVITFIPHRNYPGIQLQYVHVVIMFYIIKAGHQIQQQDIYMT